MPSSPLVHGFDAMHATLEVAPTATANCMCDAAWNASCDFGHDGGPEHCTGGPAAGGPDGCCFNYWREDAAAPSGVANLTRPSEADDAVEVQASFAGFLDGAGDSAFVAQLSFHNCHIPYIGQAATKEACARGETCRGSNRRGQTLANYSAAQLDFYACLLELDSAVGSVLGDLRSRGLYDDTLIYFATDNGPEGNCAPAGFCEGAHYATWPGDSGALRGRKRDIWEGGHRVPTIVSWPSVVGRKRDVVNWMATVTTMDFFATVLEVMAVDRPEAQRDWPLDGQSLLPILRGDFEAWPTPRRLAVAFHDWPPNSARGYGYRSGRWKLVVGSTSCGSGGGCSLPMLFDLSTDVGEAVDLAAEHPDLVEAMERNFSDWATSVSESRAVESECPDGAPWSGGLPHVHV